MESVVLLDASGRAIGEAPKATVHGGDTPLHLAFSAYLTDTAGRLLLTRRALDKLTFPGVWTNTVCGHPGPGEDLIAAVRRRARAELGLEVEDLRLVLPGFSYRAEMGGIVENELCPVLAGRIAEARALRPGPAEVADTAWVDWASFSADVIAGRRSVSPWCRDQVVQLAALGDDPAGWGPADPSGLPPAARKPTDGAGAAE